MTTKRKKLTDREAAFIAAGKPAASQQASNEPSGRQMALSVRVDEKLMGRLAECSYQRKKIRVHPWLKQDLCAAALDAHLTALGY